MKLEGLPEEQNEYTPVFEHYKQCDHVTCECGVLYCSEQCKEFDKGHELLCKKLDGLLKYCQQYL